MRATRILRARVANELTERKVKPSSQVVGGSISCRLRGYAYATLGECYLGVDLCKTAAMQLCSIATSMLASPPRRFKQLLIHLSYTK